MKNITLVIMAAGIGSRFGGEIKQLEPVGPNGEIIMDYSIHDALEAGCNKVVFIIRKDIEKDLNLKVNFADPHSPWQRGSNENVNDVFRFFFPRGFDFRTLSRERLDAVLDLINNRPRKCLDFISPVDFFNKTVALGLTI